MEIFGLSDEQSREYCNRANPEKPRYVVGFDVGQAVDPSALCVGEYYRRRPTPRPLHVRHLERVPLKTSYPDVVHYVAKMIRAEPLTRSNCDLVIDATGVGRPLVDMLRRAGCDPVAVTFTAGTEAVEVESRVWRVPKADLVAALSAKLSTETLKIAPELRDAEALKSELQSFQLKATQRGESYSAESGAHDDLAVAVMLAAWWADLSRRVEVL